MAYYYKGLTLIELKDYRMALKAFDSGLMFNPKNKMIITEKDKVHFIIENYFPNEVLGSASDYKKKGTMFYKNELYSIAIEYFDKAIKKDSVYFKAYRNRAVCYYSIQEFKKAETDLLKANSISGKSDIELMEKIRLGLIK